MSAVAEASILLREIAEPRPVGDSVKAAIGRAARRVGLGYRRSKRIWYRETNNITSEEMDALRREADRRELERIGRKEAAAAVDILVALRGYLAEADPHFNQPAIAGLDDAIRAMGGSVRPMAVWEE